MSSSQGTVFTDLPDLLPGSGILYGYGSTANQQGGLFYVQQKGRRPL